MSISFTHSLPFLWSQINTLHKSIRLSEKCVTLSFTSEYRSQITQTENRIENITIVQVNTSSQLLGHISTYWQFSVSLRVGAEALGERWSGEKKAHCPRITCTLLCYLFFFSGYSLGFWLSVWIFSRSL